MDSRAALGASTSSISSTPSRNEDEDWRATRAWRKQKAFDTTEATVLSRDSREAGCARHGSESMQLSVSSEKKLVLPSSIPEAFAVATEEYICRSTNFATSAAEVEEIEAS